MAGHFFEFGLMEEICQCLEELEWKLPTDIQAEAIPMILGGTDVLMAAETGTGKTGAFLIPVVQIVHETISLFSSKPISQGLQKNWRMSTKNRDPSFSLTEDGLCCQSLLETTWQGCKCESGIKEGRAYFEVSINKGVLSRVGWSTFEGSRVLGTDEYGFGFGGTGKKSNSGKFEDYGRPFSSGDTIGCFIDTFSSTISFSVNRENFGVAFTIPKKLKGKGFYPCVNLKNADCTFNFGDEPFKFDHEKYDGCCNIDPQYVTLFQAEINSKPLSNASSPSAIILEPSRELASQVFHQIDLLTKYIPNNKPSAVLIIGGENSQDQISKIKKGVDIIVSTPRKLYDLAINGSINLQQVKFLVLDEADALLKMELHAINDLCMRCSSLSGKLQYIVCSATLHNSLVANFAEKHMPFAVWIDLKGQDSVPDTVHHVVCRVDPLFDDSWKNYVNIYQTDNIHTLDSSNPKTPEYISRAIKYLKVHYVVTAIKKHQMDQVMIFCRTKMDCDNLENYFKKLGGGPTSPYSHQFSCRVLHSDRPQEERAKNLTDFKKKIVRILICTAVAARGIDIQGVPYVICVTFPDEKSNYVHMIGRVGRAERMGLSISLVANYKEKVWFHRCNMGRCQNTALLENGGCCIWLNELELLKDIEDHLVETIHTIETSMDIPINEFDGKVVYGAKNKQKGDNYLHNTEKLKPIMKKLIDLESKAQSIYLKSLMKKNLS